MTQRRPATRRPGALSDDGAVDHSPLPSHIAWSEGELLRAVVAASPVAIYVVDPDGLVELWNPAAERLFGWRAVEALGRRLPFVGPEDLDQFDRLRALAMNGEPFSGMEATRRRRDGSAVEIAISTAALRDADGVIRAVLGMAQDISDRRAVEAELVRQVRVDSLTGVHNRGHFLELLAREIAERPTSTALALLDLDDFKGVNDTFGHPVGDELLVALARRLVTATARRGIVGRLGSDEFVVAMLDVGAARLAAAVGALVDAVAAPVDSSVGALSLRATVGATHAADGGDVRDVLRRAGLALLEAKRSMPGSFRLFDEEMARAAMESKALESQLHGAIERGEIVVHYQPVVDLATGAMTGVEAIARWAHPELGMLDPARILGGSRPSSLAADLGIHVVREACAQLQRWERVHPAGRRLMCSVNLPAYQLRHPALAAEVAAALREAGVAPSRLQVEFTEDPNATDEDELALARLGRLGVRLAIDSFGTGYSSLAALRRFPFSALKIDGSFVAGLARGWEDRAIVVAMLSLGTSLGLTVIADGVESDEQLATLRELGCAQAEGPLLGSATGPGEIAERLATS
ncbi:MAG TPA: EAL domain-containing protein [Acidimicrobiales bacterium]|nr:EAL domain-containing protein [Acidimicrobiales bacterium]